MKNKTVTNSILGFLILFFNISGYAQSEIHNNQEAIRLNNLLRKHSKNTDSLTFYANELLRYSKENNLEYWTYNAYVALGNSERISGNIIESNNSYHHALGIAEAISDKKSQYKVMNNIAMNHKRLNRNDSAYYYFKKLDKYHSKQLEVLPASIAKMNIGLTFFQYQELDSANYYLKNSYNGFIEAKNKRFIAQNLNLLGELQLQKEAYSKALEYANSSLNLANENNFKFLLPTNYSLLSRIYTSMGNEEKADEYSNLAKESRPKNMEFSNSKIANLNDAIREDKAKAYESVLNDSEDSKMFYKANFFIILIVVLLLGIVIYFLLKRNRIIKNEVKVIQQNIEIIRESKVGNKVVDEKVIQLKSKASINSSNILYVKSDGHYVEYHLDTKKNPEVDRNTMIEVEKLLPSKSFVRIHKSYIVNINKIKIINSTKIMLDTGEWINLSRVYKERLKNILHKE
ncbi:hypothetical protein DI383_03000 [Flavobacteriaceae bacterium LYZ1037]|nr:hypothetical protein DI383_03000 [Flavobacteriaceae bacterium LYZ1037]